MYIVLDPSKMMRVKAMHTRRRTTPLKGYDGTILLSPGTKIELIPSDSFISRTSDGFWEAHVKLDDESRKNLATSIDAIAFL